jgi:hypothetical protein
MNTNTGEANTTTERVISKIFEDYEAVRGTVIELPAGSWIYGYFGETDDGGDVLLKTPIKVKVDASVPEHDLIRDMGSGWIDPVYSVSIVEGSEETANLRSCWIHGKSYNTKTMQEE